MSYSVELNKEIAEFQFEVSADDFAHELEKEIFKSKDKLNLSVYRDGKVPNEVLQQMYDKNELLKRTMNTVIGLEYEKAMNECGYIALAAPNAKVISCQKNEPFKFLLKVLIKPEIQLCEYTNIKVKPHNFEVPESDFNQMLENIRHQYANTIEITDRAAMEGDRVYIDFEGFLYGRPFEGNKANNFPLLLGSHSFIPGFEEQVIGVRINEAKDFTVTYPENYQVETLAGKDVVFRCIVRRITRIELPELTDELIREKTEFPSLDTYKENLHKSMEFQKRVFEMKNRENAVLKVIIDGSECITPEPMVQFELARLEKEQDESCKKRGITLERHLKSNGITEEEFRAQNQIHARNRVKTRLVLLEIAQREQLVPTKEEFDNEIKNVAKKLNRSEESFEHPFSKEQVMNEIKIQKALRFIMNHVVEVEEM